jgi:hypothetical protein
MNERPRDAYERKLRNDRDRLCSALVAATKVMEHEAGMLDAGEAARHNLTKASKAAFEVIHSLRTGSPLTHRRLYEMIDDRSRHNRGVDRLVHQIRVLMLRLATSS